mmetsp:Transcript_15707/g.22998  ORF Transcript_15707/g.22998 Transcript_15707/m.22998 type:complete len:408 (+) Transcript_15707:164-1387(+)
MKAISISAISLAALLHAPTPISSLPVSFHIEKGRPECYYTNLEIDEYITTSLFILSGDSLKARTILQGPITPSSISSSAEVLAAAMRLDKLGRNRDELSYNNIEDLDFGSMYEEATEDYAVDDDFDDGGSGIEYGGMDDDPVDDVVLQDYYYYDDDDEYEFMEDDAMDDQEIMSVRKAKAERDGMSPEERAKFSSAKKERKRKESEAVRKKSEAKKKERLAQQLAKKKSKRENEELRKRRAEMQAINEGKPLEKTFMVEEDGWYRFCVEATHNLIEVEFELRRSSELGHPNKKTGHLQTYERHDMMQSEHKLMEKLAAASKTGGAVKEEDLETTKNQITKMNRLLNEIREKQNNERHRLAVHKSVNEHSHSRMVIGSLFETVFYIAVSAFQVYTIRKWFSGSPILGY